MTISKYTGTNYIIVHTKKEQSVAIDRSSQWGNPFPLQNPKDEVARQECVAKYRADLWRKIQGGDVSQLERLIKRKNQGKPLKLGCWCAPRLCHGDVLAAACDWYETTTLNK